MTARSALGASSSLACLLGLLAASAPARAQPKPAEVARAAVLVERANQKLAAKETNAACALFEESYGADPQVGTMFDLANCHERAGRFASAHAELTLVITMATKMGQSKRAEAARERAKALEPTLSRVLLDVHERDPGLVVKIDGRALLASDVRAGAAIPVDAGRHVIMASAPGKAPWRSTLEILPGPHEASCEVPALDDLPAEPGAPVARTPSQRVLTRPSPPPLRTFAWVAGAGAAAALVTGGVGVGVSAASDDASASWKTVSTVGFVSAGVLAVTSAVLFLLSTDAPRRTEARAPSGALLTF